MDPRLDPWTPTYAPRRGHLARRHVSTSTVVLALGFTAVVLYLIAAWWISRR